METILGNFFGDRAEEIELWDRELNGLLTMFAKLCPEDREQVLADVKKIKREVGDDPERVLLRVKALGKFYNLVSSGLPDNDDSGKKPKDVLTERLAELAAGVEGLDTVH